MHRHCSCKCQYIYRVLQSHKLSGYLQHIANTAHHQEDSGLVGRGSWNVSAHYLDSSAKGLLTVLLCGVLKKDPSNNMHGREMTYIVPVQCPLEHLWLKKHQVRSQITQ